MSRAGIVDSLSRAGRDVNEDAFGATGDLAWIIDGATGVSERRFTPDVSDARWYAETLNRTLAELAQRPSCRLGPLLATAIHQTSAAFNVFGGELQETHDPPSASVAIVRVHDDMIEYAILGDCAVLVRSGRGVVSLNDRRIEPFERVIVERAHSLAVSGIRDMHAAREALLPALRELRDHMNRPGGYYVASLDPAVAENAVTGVIQGVRPPLVLVTDGFMRLYEVFGAYTATSFYERATTAGLDALYRELRRMEDDDADLTRHARVKQKDDASSLVISW